MNLSEEGAQALPTTEDVSNVFSNQFGVSGLLEMADELFGAIFIRFFNVLNQVSSCFSCLTECYDAVLL